MAAIVLERVSRVYPGGVRAVHEIDLEVKDSELFVLVGPSGCGKTTTLRMIAGWERPSAGTIRIGPQVVNELPPRDRDLAMVVQGSALYPHLSVRENLAFGLRRRSGGWFRPWWLRVVDPAASRQLAEQKRSIASRVDEVARRLDIASLLARRPAQLSGGERQRVALGRALVREPAAFLMDEPLSSLDAPLRAELRRELKRLRRQSPTTILYVTHDQVEALTLGERIAVMDRGVLQQVGRPRDVYERPRNRFVAGFIGSPPMSFVTARLERSDRDGRSGWSVAGDGWRWEIGELLPPTVRAGGERMLEIGIRAEHLRLADAADCAPSAVRVGARVEQIEPQGDSQVVYLRLPAGELTEHNKAGEGRMAGNQNGSENGMPQRNESSSRALIAARLAATTELAIGQSVQIDVDLRRLHWFDPQTGENVGLDDSVHWEGMPSTTSRRRSDLPASECRP